MSRLLAFIASTFFVIQLFSQKEANVWYFGANAGVDFNSGSPVALTNGVLNTSEGSAAISDGNGSLLFYTDGITVWNRNHLQMTNGFGLMGDPSSAQSGIIVPKPGSTTFYYIFTVAAQGNPGGFCYSEVDMTLNGGLGDVIAATKNTQLFTPSVEKCTAVKHANGLYVWVIGHGFNNNRYYAYLVNCSGVNLPVVTDVGSVEGWPGWGCLTASTNGSQLTTAMRTVGFELLDFNNATGVVSNPVFLGQATECYGVSFSPDNNLLYGLKINSGELFQWNLQAGSPAAIVASATLIGIVAGNGAPYRGGTMQIGPDGILYMTQYGQPYLGAVLSPNTLGIACNLQSNVVNLSGRNSLLGLPPFIQSYFDTTAVINYNTGINCVGSPVTFTISSNTSFLDSVRWDFDDLGSGAQNNTSALLSPAHAFSSSGNFNVQLIRFLGCIADTAYQSIYITPTANSSQNISICPGTTFTRPGGSIASTGGTYIDTIPASTGCDSIITTQLNIATVNVDAGANVAICNGQSTQLNATGGLIYSWTPAAGLSNLNINNPIASPATTTTYIVSSQIEVGNSIVNGDFSSGNTGFSSSYTYTPPPNTTEGQYNIGINAQLWNGAMASCGDHTTGNGNMLQVNGATTPNVPIYCQTVSVIPGTDYAFSTWLMTLSPGNLAQLQFSINGNLLGSVFTANASTCIWQQFYTTWNSGTGTSATICIVNQNTNAGANDFALDDISFSLLCTATDSVTVTVHPTYSSIVNAAICQNEVYTLPDGSLTSAAGTYIDTLLSVNACDSIITTNLTLYPTYSYTVNQTICPSDIYTLPDGTSTNISGTYYDTLATINGCDSVIITNLTVVQPSITVSNDTQICFGSSAQLSASGGLYTYSWTPSTGLNDPGIANPVATPAQTTSYIVSTQVASGDLIANGDFSGGNAGFTSAYIYQSNLYPEGVYYIGSNPNTYHPGFVACTDHTGGAGNMMIVNGAATPNLSVWCQTINVVPNTNYAFGCWVTSVAAGSPAVLQFEINGGLLATPFNAPAGVCGWKQFYTIWNSGVNTTANICIINQNTSTGGNDFALDDISFIGLCDVTDTVTITVHNPTTANIDISICEGNTYTFPDGGTSTISVIDTSLLQDRFGCDSIIITVLTVNPSPVTTVYDTICSNQNYIRPSGTSVNTSGMYTDTLATSFGCDSIIFTYLTVYSVSATAVSDTICNGASYLLPDGSGVTASGTYPVTLANQYGCDSVVTTSLTVIDLLLSTQNTNVLCNGDSTATISSASTGGVLPYSYDLTQGGNIVSNNTNGGFSSLAAGNYAVNVTDDFGCTVSSSVQITEPSALLISDNVTNVRCFGESNGQVVITGSGGTLPYLFSLDGQSQNTTGTFSSLSAGSYSYTITDGNGCVESAIATVTEPQQLIMQVTPQAVTLQLGESIQLNSSSNYDPLATYTWPPSFGLSCTDCPNPEVEIYENATYTVRVTTMDGNDCTAEAGVSVKVIPDYDLFIPNSFTPNGDGINDFFQLFGNLAGLKYLNVQVFDRIGEKVFESDDLAFRWDGTYKGRSLAPAVFVYTVKAVFLDNFSEKIYKGSLTLLR